MALHRIADLTLSLPRIIKRLIVLAVDASLCVFTVWLAFYLRLDVWMPLSDHSVFRPLVAAGSSVALALPVFIVFGLYRTIFRHSGGSSLLSVFKAVATYGLLFAAVFTAIGVSGVPRSVGLVQPILLLLAVGASRALAHAWLSGLYHDRLADARRRRVLIYGAGASGRQLAAALSNSRDMRVAGFLDDQPQLQGQVLNGHLIYKPENLPALVTELEVNDIFLALPSISRQRRNQILQSVLPAHVSVRTLPTLSELAQGKVSINDLRELDVDDLLGREPVAPDPALLTRNITGKVVLVTGAGGSIGSELCRQIFDARPATLLLVEQSEFALYAIHHELSQRTTLPDGTVPLVAALADAGNAARMSELMKTWQPQTLYHAAAYKHVPLVEQNPAEGIRNNVFATRSLALTAIEHGIADFVLISTDKAVRPTSVMGATKRLAEMVLQALDAEQRSTASRSRTRFSMVRFGNVLGSSGSVVPLFRQQIRAGGPVTVTHPDVTRYFMTIPEAAQLVIQAGAMARGGEVFVLDMGTPLRIHDLARRMIELSGLTVRDEQAPDGDIEIQITGLRAGEKLHEELLIGTDASATEHPRILRANEHHLAWPSLEAALTEMGLCLGTNDPVALGAALQRLIAEYGPQCAGEHPATSRGR